MQPRTVILQFCHPFPPSSPDQRPPVNKAAAQNNQSRVVPAPGGATLCWRAGSGAPWLVDSPARWWGSSSCAGEEAVRSPPACIFLPLSSLPWRPSQEAFRPASAAGLAAGRARGSHCAPPRITHWVPAAVGAQRHPACPAPGGLQQRVFRRTQLGSVGKRNLWPPDRLEAADQAVSAATHFPANMPTCRRPAASLLLLQVHGCACGSTRCRSNQPSGNGRRSEQE